MALQASIVPVVFRRGGETHSDLIRTDETKYAREPEPGITERKDIHMADWQSPREKEHEEALQDDAGNTGAGDEQR